MSIGTNYSNVKASSYQPVQFNKGTISEDERDVCFKGDKDSQCQIEQLVYTTGKLEVTLHDNVNVGKFDDSAFSNVGLRQMWMFKTTFVNGEENIKTALIGLKNQGHIPNEFSEKVLARIDRWK